MHTTKFDFKYLSYLFLGHYHTDFRHHMPHHHKVHHIRLVGIGLHIHLVDKVVFDYIPGIG